MIRQSIVVTSETGFHARPASLFTKRAQSCKADVKIQVGDKIVDGKSILGILSLGISKGSIIELIIDGEDEQAAMEALAPLVNE